ncbi:MAG: hypothetical protein R2867_21520 [Caldilineaceae bacterium]
MTSALAGHRRVEDGVAAWRLAIGWRHTLNGCRSRCGAMGQRAQEPQRWNVGGTADWAANLINTWNSAPAAHSPAPRVAADCVAVGPAGAGGSDPSPSPGRFARRGSYTPP